ncbi:MAG: HNH endonuclease signature motif containing protein [Candidatus Nitrosocosmicus sp.]
MLGICRCGCNEDIPIRSTGKILQKYKNLHHSKEDKNATWKGGRVVKRGYVFIKMLAHPFCNKEGYVREHRLVMEKHLGRYLNKNEVVHHINGIKDDNRIDNLQLFSSNSIHISTEYLEKRKKKFCSKCLSKESYKHTKRNTENWYVYKGETVCSKCYSKTPEQIEARKIYYRKRKTESTSLLLT